MSRIQEALRVAALGAAGTSAVETPLPADAAVLGRYPREAGAADFAPSSPRPAAEASLPRVESRTSAVAAELEGRVVGRNAAPVAVEQYRRLAGALHELQAASGTKTLMVTSALPSEGKTLTVVNLSLTLSESYGQNVLLVDADLRRPSVHDVFGVRNTRGLSDGLRNGGEFPVVSVSPRLSILPAGRPDPDPMASLTSDRMRALLDESAKAFDWVLLDAPPVGIMPDANLLVRLTHGVLFVIGAGLTPYALVNRAIGEIGRDNIVGTVLNRIDEASMPVNGYYHQYYQVPRS